MGSGVFIADPQPFFCEALAAALATRDVDVVGWSSDEKDAGARLDASPKAVLLTELDLNAGSGLSLIRRTGHRVRSFVLTRRDEAEVLFDALDVGAAGCLSHATSFDRLVELLGDDSSMSFVLDPERVHGILKRLQSRAQPASEEEARLARLTPREREVLELLSRGLSKEGIGEALYLSPNTVRTHIGSILKKLEVHSRAEAARIALRVGHPRDPDVQVVRLSGPDLGL